MSAYDIIFMLFFCLDRIQLSFFVAIVLFTIIEVACFRWESSEVRNLIDSCALVVFAVILLISTAIFDFRCDGVWRWMSGAKFREWTDCMWSVFRSSSRHIFNMVALFCARSGSMIAAISVDK